MVAIQPKTYTAEEFWEFVNLPENRNKSFERRHGEIIEPPLSTGYSSETAALITYHLVAFTLPKNIGHVTTSDGGYHLSDKITYSPDVAFISNKHQEKLSYNDFVPSAPDLAVEIISPATKADYIHTKIMDYAAAGTQIVWEVYPKLKMVFVHTGLNARPFKEADTLDGGDVLPGFTLPVRDIFPK